MENKAKWVSKLDEVLEVLEVTAEKLAILSDVSKNHFNSLMEGNIDKITSDELGRILDTINSMSEYKDLGKSYTLDSILVRADRLGFVRSDNGSVLTEELYTSIYNGLNKIAVGTPIATAPKMTLLEVLELFGNGLLLFGVDHTDLPKKVDTEEDIKTFLLSNEKYFSEFNLTEIVLGDKSDPSRYMLRLNKLGVNFTSRLISGKKPLAKLGESRVF